MGSKIQIKRLKKEIACRGSFLCVLVLSLTMIGQSLHPGNCTTNYKKYIIDFWFPLQINITLKSEMPVQIDGEPWMQAAGSVIVRPILTQVFLKD